MRAKGFVRRSTANYWLSPGPQRWPKKVAGAWSSGGGQCGECTQHGTTQYPIRRAQRLRRVLISAAVLPPNDSVCLHYIIYIVQWFTHARRSLQLRTNNNNNNKNIIMITWIIAVLIIYIIAEWLMVVGMCLLGLLLHYITFYFFGGHCPNPLVYRRIVDDGCDWWPLTDLLLNSSWSLMTYVPTYNYNNSYCTSLYNNVLFIVLRSQLYWVGLLVLRLFRALYP